MPATTDAILAIGLARYKSVARRDNAKRLAEMETPPGRRGEAAIASIMAQVVTVKGP